MTAHEEIDGALAQGGKRRNRWVWTLVPAMAERTLRDCGSPKPLEQKTWKKENQKRGEEKETVRRQHFREKGRDA